MYFFFVGLGLVILEQILRPHDRLKRIEEELRELTKDANDNATTLLAIEVTLDEIAAHFSG
jgi:hypothetical protein